MVSRANPDLLTAAATSLLPVIRTITNDALGMSRAVTDLDWRGSARTQAVGRVDHEKTQMNRVSAAVTALRKAFIEGEAAMGPLVVNLKSSVANLTEASYDVAEDWTVTDGYQYGLADAAADGDDDATDRLEQIKNERAEVATNETIRLQRLAHELAAADVTCSSAISTANAGIVALAPVASGLSSEQADIDLRALRDHRATPEQIARLRAATHLTAEQTAALRDGRPARIPQGQFDYLEKLGQDLDGVSLTEMLDMDPAAPGALGDALRLIGTPDIQTTAGEHGGVERLPLSVKTLLQQDPTMSGIAVHGVVGVMPTLWTKVNRLDDFRALNSLLAKGNQSLRLGSDVDRGLLKQASEISKTMGPRGSGSDLGGPGDRQERDTIRQTVDAMLHNASGDHQAVTDFVTGEHMAGLVTAGNHFHADEHLLNLLEAKWEPDETGAKEVLEWVGDAADAPGREGELGGRAGEALGRFMVDHHTELAYIDTQGGQHISLGQLNPELTQQLARSVAPYFPNFADVPDDMLVNHHAGPLESTHDLAKIVGLLGTDPTAAHVVIKAAASWENHLAYEFGENTKDVGLGRSSGLLHRAVEEGFADAKKILTDNHEWSQTLTHTDRAGEASRVLALLQGSGIPGVMEAATMYGPEAQDSYAGPEPGDPKLKEHWDDQLKDYDSYYDKLTDGSVRKYQILSGYIATHPEVIEHQWSGDGKTQIDFFTPGGAVNWDAVEAEPDRFTSFLASLGLDDDKYVANLGEHATGTTIDDTTRETPHPAVSPPR